MEQRKELTEKQKKLIDYILAYTSKNGYQPSLEEAGGYFQVSSAGIHEMLKLIKKKGYVEFTGKSRGLKIIV